MTTLTPRTIIIPDNRVHTVRTVTDEGHPIQISTPQHAVHLKTPPPTNAIHVHVSGPPGPAGRDGLDTGEIQIGEVEVTRIDHSTPSTTWRVDIGRPIGSLRVIDSAGSEVEPGSIIQSGTSIDLIFSAAFSGTVYVTG